MVEKKKPIKIKKSLVGIVLDRSASMGSLRDEIIGAFNEQIDNLKKAKVDTEVSFVTFSTAVDDFVMKNEPAKKTKKLTKEDYQPDGLTALNDAIITMANHLQEHPSAKKQDASILLMVFTDGQENNSQRPTEEVRGEIERLKATGRWTITYMGANFDPMTVSHNYGISLGNIGKFDATKKGVTRMRGIVTSCVNLYSTSLDSGVASTDNFYNNAGK